MNTDDISDSNLPIVFPSLHKHVSVQINGCKIIGPPANWSGHPPPNTCELFVKKIPKRYSEHQLLSHFQRFGIVYEFRIMLDFHDQNRGYAYVRYTKEEDAAKAKEVMSHFYIYTKRLLEVKYSYDKCRLFIGGIPKHINKEEIKTTFSQIFPKLKQIVFHNRICDGNKNRGFVFIDFPSHKDALEVKKIISPGRIMKWGCDLKVVWANHKGYIDPGIMMKITTLFIRNIDTSVQIEDLQNVLLTVVQKGDVRKVSVVREYAFIDFKNRDAAKKVLHELQGVELNDHKLVIEWALPQFENSPCTLKNIDYDRALRLKCIANSWEFPVIVFGRIFENGATQYAAVMLRNSNSSRILFVELRVSALVDIQSRLCEVVCKLIEQTGGLPLLNYVIKVIDEIFDIVGIITNVESAVFVKARGILDGVILYWEEVRDLCFAMNYLSLHTQDYIISLYHESLQQSQCNTFTYLRYITINKRIFGCVDPAHRNKPPLIYKVNNTQIIFALCHSYSLTNYIFPNTPVTYSLWDIDNATYGHILNECTINYCRNYLSPISLQSHHAKLITVVYFGKQRAKEVLSSYFVSEK